jgi:hypothetical protein
VLERDGQDESRALGGRTAPVDGRMDGWMDGWKDEFVGGVVGLARGFEVRGSRLEVALGSLCIVTW